MKHTAKVSTLKVNITPFAFKMYAEDYLKIPQALPRDRKYSPALYFSYCRSIELFLKALILHNGIPKNKPPDEYLRGNFGHNLEKSVRFVEKENIFSFSNKERKEIKKANDYYNEKGFEYYTKEMLGKTLKGYPDLPNKEMLKKITSRLKEKCEKIGFLK